MKIGGSVAFLNAHEKSCKQRMNVRRPNVCESGSSGDGRSIYQERAGRVGGCSTALRCPGAVASVQS